MIRVGDRVSVPKAKRDCWGLPHLTGEYYVVKVEGWYVEFDTKEPRFRKRYRRWHISNLLECTPCLENK